MKVAYCLSDGRWHLLKGSCDDAVLRVAVFTEFHCGHAGLSLELPFGNFDVHLNVWQKVTRSPHGQSRNQLKIEGLQIPRVPPVHVNAFKVYVLRNPPRNPL